jgi:23S rRNA (pseudouridine1915-N3)-methyltransferase
VKLRIVAVGRLKHGPERELAERYLSRAADVGNGLGFRSFDVREIAESRAHDTDARKADEARAIAAQLDPGATVFCLDEHGQNLDSAALAAAIAKRRDGGTPEIVFVVGGADGLSPELLRQSHVKLAFGAVTWPHQLVRVMLLEQIYRAMTILSGHPYHRA